MKPKIFTLGGYKYSMNAITFELYNAKEVGVPYTGIVPDIELDDWNGDYVDYGKDEPLIATALSRIAGVTRATPAVPHSVHPCAKVNRSEFR